MNKSVDSTKIHQKMNAEDDRYQAKKLGLGRQGAHEGWLKAEEAVMKAETDVSADVRHEMITVAAYYLAKKRGFAGHGAIEDWIKAEYEIDAMLHERIEKS